MSDAIVGSVGVQLVPSARGFVEKTKSLLSGMKVDVGINLDDKLALAQMEEVTRPRDATVDANADTGAAEAELDVLARDRSVDVNVNVDKHGGLAAASQGMSGLVTGAILLGPALVPVTAAVAGLVGMLGAPLAIAGGGATLFALLAGGAVKETNKELKAIDKMDAKLATLTKGTAQYKGVQEALKSAIDDLSPAQKRYRDDLGKLQDTFQTFIKKKAGDALLGPVAAGLRLLTVLLPKVTPIVKVVGGVLSDMLDGVSKRVESGGFKTFLDTFAHRVGPLLISFSNIAKNVFLGIFGLFKGFDKASGGVVKGLENITAKFAKFGEGASKSKGFQDFLDYVALVGPQVFSTLGSVAGALVHIGTALAPIGKVSLGGIKVLADVISAIPTDILTTLLGLFIGVTAALKVLTAVTAIYNAVLDANPISLVVLAIAALAAGLIYAYNHSKTFRKIVDGAFRAIAEAARFMWNKVVAPILRFMISAFGVVAGVWAKVVGALSKVPGFHWLKPVAKGLQAVADGAKNAANHIKDIPPNKSVKVTANTGAASAALAGILNQVRALDGAHAAVTVGVTKKKGHAQGGTVYAGDAPGPINEIGQELFIPATNGRVLSHQDSMKVATAAMSGGGSGPMSVSIYDKDNVLLGTFDARADKRIAKQSGLNNQTSRASRVSVRNR